MSRSARVPKQSNLRSHSESARGEIRFGLRPSRLPPRILPDRKRGKGELQHQAICYTYPQLLSQNAATGPGSDFNRQAGSKFNRRRQVGTRSFLPLSCPVFLVEAPKGLSESRRCCIVHASLMPEVNLSTPLVPASPSRVPYPMQGTVSVLWSAHKSHLETRRVDEIRMWESQTRV